MTCDHCVQGITKTIMKPPGITACEVSLENKSAEVSYAADQVSSEELVAAINKLGYTATAQ